MIHLVFLAPYEELRGKIEQVFQERSDRDEISCEIMADQFNNDLAAALHGDAIISRGFTALKLKRLGIPYAELKTTGYDVIAAVDSFLRTHTFKKIAIVGASNMVYGAENIGAVYRDIEIRCYAADDELKLRELTEHAIADGAQAIVGGCSTIACASEYGIPSVLIESGKEAINSAIDEALQTVQITRAERLKSSQIANIMNYSFQGIVSTDHEGIITLANNYCYNLLGVTEQELLGQQLCAWFPDIHYQEVVERGIKILSEIHRVRDITIMVNCVPIEGNECNVGCVLTFQDITQIQEEEGKIRKRFSKKGFVSKYRFENIYHRDEATAETIRVAKSYSNSNSSLLILGETGVGKELFAQSVHNASSRRNEPFVAINCASLPEDLLESELFGYVEGAFTGAAKSGKMGLFELAHKGTIFLDEIGDISAKLQGRLLRVLQEREILRLGHDTVIPIDVRVISATNRDLQEAVGKGIFRMDLLYRLDVLRLIIPPIRQRRKDISCLIDHFIDIERAEAGCRLKGLEPAAQELVRSYDWPGNVRELRNFCERLCVLCTQEYAGVSAVSAALDMRMSPLPASGRSTVAPAAQEALRETERELIEHTLQMHGSSRKETAAALGIDTSTLWRKMKRYGIQ